MGLIGEYKQDLVGKVFLYVLEGTDSSCMYCIAKVVSLLKYGAYFEVISTNIFATNLQWFFEKSLIDNGSRIIEDVNVNYLKLFQKFFDNSLECDEYVTRKYV